MNKKSISMMLAGLMMFSNATSAFAMSNEVDQHIQGNSLLIGNYLFELDKNANSFGLDSFITSARSIADGQDNEVYYKDASGNWYELIEDGSMSSSVTIDKIKNAITVRNGVAENTDPNVLASSDLLVSPSTIVESTALPGTFDTEVTVTIKASNNAKFATNVGTTVDSISSASLVRTGPTGTNMQITRLDDKNIKLKLIGTASSHVASLNTVEGTTDNQKDYNKNGQFGDIKFLMLPSFFTGVNSVAEGGQYVVLDVQFNDGAVEDRIIDVAKTKMLTVEQVDYGVLALNEGNIDTYNFTLNGAVLNPTKVNDSGTVVKFEMNRKQVAEVKLVSKTNAAKTDTINIGSGTEAFTVVINDQDPDRVLVSGPVSYFDYYIVDYDENGVIRSTLEKTTFDTENEGMTPVDKTVPALTLEKARTPLGDDIVINVAEPNSKLSKEWMANVYEVLKDYDTSASSRVPLQFSVDADAGKITILAKSTAINDRHGHHEVVIKSNSFNEVHVNFELIEPAGDLYLSSNFNWWANNELLFELRDFNYAVTNPIHSVFLDGEELEGDCEDYHVVSNLVRLENGAIEKLTVGEHTLVIKIHGFEDYTRTFTLEQAPDGASNPTYGSPDDSAEEDESAMLSVDAVSAASGAIGGGSNGGSSDGSSGGGAIRANVIYDFDHISNAFILKGLGMDTPYVNKTINWWHSFTKDALIKNGSSVLMDYDFYTNNVGINGQYNTYEAATAALPSVNPEPSEYMDKDYDKPAALYLNRPYSVKNMLHDSVMGETYYYSEVTATPAPSLTVKGNKVLYGNNVVIDYTGEAGDTWAEALVSVKENSAYMKFDVDKDANTITFTTEKNSFLTGDNSFIFKSEGFTTSTLKVEIYKAEQADVAIKKDDDNNVIVGDFDADFMEHLGGISLAGEVLYNDSQYGNGAGDYEITDNQIILRSKLFGAKEDQNALDAQVTLQVNAEGYTTFVKNFTHEDLAGGKIEPKDVPSNVVVDDENSLRTNTSVKVVAGVALNHEYYDKIQELYLDGVKLEKSQYETDTFWSYIIDGSLFSEEKEYTVKVVADGYKEKELTVTISNDLKAVPVSVTFDQNEKNVAMGTELILNLDSDTVYHEGVTEIIVNGKSYNKSSFKNNEYKITSLVSEGANTITVKALNYVDKVFTVTIAKATSPAKLVIDDKLSEESKIVLNKPKDVKITLEGYTTATYMDKLTAVKIGGVTLENDAYTIKQEGVGTFTYNVLTLSAEKFEYDKSYEVSLEANGYESITFKVEVEAKVIDESHKLDVPDVVKLNASNKYIPNEDVQIVLQDSPVNDGYLDNINEVYVNDLKLESDKYEIANHNLVLDGSLFTEEKEYSVKIINDLYKSKVFNVEVKDTKLEVPSYVTFDQDNKTVTMGDDIVMNFDDSTLNLSDYANNVSKVTVNDDEYMVINPVKSYSIVDKVKTGLNTIVVEASTYENKTFKVTVLEGVPSTKWILSDPDVVTSEHTVEMPEKVEIALGHYNELHYKNAIKEILINDVKVPESNYSVVSQSPYMRLILNRENFDYGNTYAIKIKADGYSDAELTLTIKEKAPDKAVPSYVKFEQDGQSVDVGTALALSFKEPGNWQKSEYAKLIRQIKINEETFDVDLTTNSYDITSKVSLGLNTVIVKAETYADKEFTITISEGVSPAKYYNEAGGGTIEETDKTIKYPKSVKISLGDYNDTFYQNAIEEIQLDGVKLSESNYEIVSYSGKQLVLNKENFEFGTNYTVKIKAKGFNDSVFNLTVDAKGATVEVPDFVKVNSDEIRIGKGVQIKTRESGGILDYEETVTEIEIDPITSTGAATVIKTKADLIYEGFNYSHLNITNDLLELGENKITVKSMYFDDYSCIINVLPKAVPSYVGIWGLKNLNGVLYQFISQMI